MKRKIRTTSRCEEGIASFRKKFIKHPLLQRHVKISASEAMGSIEVAWYRGEQAGIHSAYLIIKKKFPKAAKEILKSFNMNEDGDIVYTCK